MIRYHQDGSLVDALHDDGSNYPVGWVPEDIEPGAMMFSLWFETPNGERVSYDFGFCWDGEHSADWQCNRGDNKVPGSPSFEGKITWSNRYHFYNDVDEDEYDDLGDDLQVTYTSSSPSGEVSGQAVITDAAVMDPISRDGWVAAANDLLGFIKDQNLI
jgi:hypothetical protein